MRLKYRKFSKIHLYLFYREEAENLGVMDEWRRAKNIVITLKPIIAKYVDINYYITYGLNYINFYPKIYPIPITISDELQDDSLIEYILLRLPRLLKNNRCPVSIKQS